MFFFVKICKILFSERLLLNKSVLFLDNFSYLGCRLTEEESLRTIYSQSLKNFLFFVGFNPLCNDRHIIVVGEPYYGTHQALVCGILVDSSDILHGDFERVWGKAEHTIEVGIPGSEIIYGTFEAKLSEFVHVIKYIE